MIIYFTGFGRLYTEFGIAGRIVFYLIVNLYKLTATKNFIVENESDKNVLKQMFPKANIFITQSSGIDLSGYDLSNKPKPSNKVITFGYIARFDKSKHTQKIIEIAAQLPDTHKLLLQDLTSAEIIIKTL